MSLVSTEARRTAPKRVPIFRGLSFSVTRLLAIMLFYSL